MIQSGRAVIYPVYQDTYERRNQRELAMPGGRDSRDVVIQKTQDVSRAIDYLETRPDIDAHKLGYVGVSMGSAYGVFAAAVEPRLKAFVWIDGGFFLDTRPTDGINQAEYAPRVTQPVLMLNGKYDFAFSPELSQNPMFRMLGSPAADESHIMLDTTHDDILSQRAGVVREALQWFDQYLGRVGG